MHYVSAQAGLQCTYVPAQAGRQCTMSRLKPGRRCTMGCMYQNDQKFSAQPGTDHINFLRMGHRIGIHHGRYAVARTNRLFRLRQSGTFSVFWPPMFAAGEHWGLEENLFYTASFEVGPERRAGPGANLAEHAERIQTTAYLLLLSIGGA